MKSVVAALVAFATVSAAPFVFDHKLVVDKGHEKLSVFHHSSLVKGTGASAARLRFVHLVPKAHHLSAFSDGLSSEHGSPVKHHKFLDLESDEKLVELLGLSDCRTWHSVVLGVWSSSSRSLVHKFFSWASSEPVKSVGSLDDLVDFVHVHFYSDLYKVFAELFKKGLTSHLFTHKLLFKLSPGLKLHADLVVKL